MNKLLIGLLACMMSTAALARGVIIVPIIPVPERTVVIEESPVFYGDVDLIDSDAYLYPEEGVVIDFADCFHCVYRGGFWYGGGLLYVPGHGRREGFDHHNHEYRGHGHERGHEEHHHH